MSSEDFPTRRRHRHTRSVAPPSAEPSSQSPSNPHHLHSQAQALSPPSDINYPSQPTTPPRTPRRNNQTQNTANSTSLENGSRQKARNNKNRPKTVTKSPAVKRHERSTPPEGQSAGMGPSKPMNTPSSTIFAGATFHASPAPSSLPIPSFHSRSVPDSPGMKGLSSLRQPSLSETSEPPTPPVAHSTSKVHREESPLDFFFRADREEKERARSANSTNPTGKVTSPFQPPPVSHRHAQTPPAQGSQQRSGHLSRTSTSGSGMFAMELDASYSPAAPLGPAFSTPYSERINAAKNSKPREDSQSALDRSEALKAYLFSGHITSPPVASNLTGTGSTPFSPNSPQTASERSKQTSHSQANGFSLTPDGKVKNNGNAKTSVRTSSLRQEVTPSKTPTMTPGRNTHFANSPTPSRIYGNVTNSNSGKFAATHAASPSPALSYSVSSGDRNTDLQGMEDSLRKILKLDSHQGPEVQDPGIPPTAYIRGIDNGVMRS